MLKHTLLELQHAYKENPSSELLNAIMNIQVAILDRETLLQSGQ